MIFEGNFLKEVPLKLPSRTFKEKKKNSREEFSYLCMGKDISVPKHCYRKLRGLSSFHSASICFAN
jgi:hypothetical protein